MRLKPGRQKATRRGRQGAESRTFHSGPKVTAQLRSLCSVRGVQGGGASPKSVHRPAARPCGQTHVLGHRVPRPALLAKGPEP